MVVWSSLWESGGGGGGSGRGQGAGPENRAYGGS